MDNTKHGEGKAELACYSGDTLVASVCCHPQPCEQGTKLHPKQGADGSLCYKLHRSVLLWHAVEVGEHLFQHVKDIVPSAW